MLKKQPKILVIATLFVICNSISAFAGEPEEYRCTYPDAPDSDSLAPDWICDQSSIMETSIMTAIASSEKSYNLHLQMETCVAIR